MNVIIFGGTGGIGSELTKELERRSYAVKGVGSSDCNLIKVGDINQFVSNNPCDVLIFLAAYNFNGFLHKQSYGTIDNQIFPNLLGGTYLISQYLQTMRQNKFGRIIIASSIVEEVTQLGTAVYAACKGYYETLVKNIAMENAALEITANCLKLGYIDAAGGMLYKEMTDEQRNNILQKIPSKKFGTVEDIANVVECLIDTEYINGATIRMAGGL